MAVAEVLRQNPSAPRRRLGKFVKRHLLTVYAMAVLAYLFIPVAVVILFSFNNNQGRFNFTWQGFTLRSWRNAFDVPGLFESLLVSLRIAFLSALVATVLGTLIALALVRYSFRFRGTTNILLFLPIATPEVVLGSSVLALFITLNVATGFATIVIAHILFNISYVVVTVKARLSGFDRHLEEAAMDLYADEWTTFRKVTLPMIMPGVFAAFLLGFALSFDDFIITNFNSGQTVTFPLFIWGAARVGVPPQVNVFGTAIFVITASIMLLSVFLQRSRRTQF
ncbi:MAG: ABC transporter permease [Acidimicrobiia bacterium]|nr:ABC transporter permease [Acidimicrobiia bacterium]MDH3470921.1 ABC transporter permease [Acidimicrobiia bacterium]